MRNPWFLIGCLGTIAVGSPCWAVDPPAPVSPAPLYPVALPLAPMKLDPALFLSQREIDSYEKDELQPPSWAVGVAVRHASIAAADWRQAQPANGAFSIKIPCDPIQKGAASALTAYDIEEFEEKSVLFCKSKGVIFFAGIHIITDRDIAGKIQFSDIWNNLSGAVPIYFKIGLFSNRRAINRVKNDPPYIGRNFYVELGDGKIFVATVMADIRATSSISGTSIEVLSSRFFQSTKFPD